MYNPKLHFHFIGIGGSGMSGLAEILLRSGFRVSGSDLAVSESCRRLQECGAVIHHGHAAENLAADCSLVVYSSAVQPENPEVLEARKRKLPVIPRAEVLAELMRLKYGIAVAGSHGKTSTTSMIAAVLEDAGLDPTVVIGGLVKAIGSGGKLGKGEFLVAESDESDRSFLLLRPTIAVITNIDHEHMSAYSSITDLEESFRRFADAVPFYGLSILCIDDPRVRDLSRQNSRRQITYGVSPDAEIRAENFRQHRHVTSADVYRSGEYLFRLELPMPGRHFLVNALAAVAAGLECGVPSEKIRTALRNFTGVKRRIEVLGEVSGITVINDYGHHPTEIKATLQAVREGWSEQGSLHVVFQPHRYSRTRECFADFLGAFENCDALTLTEIYAANEEPIEGICGRTLCEAVVHPRKEFISSLAEVQPRLLQDVKSGDTVLFLGAGSVGAAADAFLSALRQA